MSMSRLFAHTAVYRVVEVLWSTETYDERPRYITGRVAYRWTRAGADRLRDKWAREKPHPSGGGYLVQLGVVHWIPDDEHDRAVEVTEWNRDQNVDDRDEYGPMVTWSRSDK